MNRFASFRSLLTIFCIISFSMIYVGCGGSEETMAEDEMITDTGAEEAVTEEEPVTEEEAIAEEEQAPEEQPAEQPEEAQQEAQQPETVEQQPVQQMEGPSRDQLQVELDSLKTENVQLKEQLTSTEQSNRELAAKISDLEAANVAMRGQPSQSKGTRAAIAPQSAVGKSSPQEIQAYESAVTRFNGKNYSDAINELQTLLSGGIKDDFADNCHYWIGVSYFQTKEYSSALQHFQQVMGYRYSEKKDDAQIMIAQCYDRMGEKDQAQAEYKKLIEMYPTSEYVGRARSRVR